MDIVSRLEMFDTGDGFWLCLRDESERILDSAFVMKKHELPGIVFRMMTNSVVWERK